MQIDVVSTSLRLRSGFGVTIDGVDRTTSFSSAYTTTHDADAAFASATLELVLPLSLAPTRHTVQIYAGWNSQADLAFAGELVGRGKTLWLPRQHLTCGGFLKRTQVGAGSGADPDNPAPLIAFYYDGGSAEDTAALLELMPAEAQAVPISTDADAIIFILERYGITPSTTGHWIEASPWIPARYEPIIWDMGSPGWQIIQELDRCSPNYRTSDGRTGAIYRRQLFGTVPSGVRHTFTQGVDILQAQIDEQYDVVNQVIVRGARIESLDEQVEARVPGSTPTPSPFIPDPPGVRTDSSIDSPYIETVEDAAMIGGELLGRLAQPLSTIALTTFGCPDIDVGDGIGVASDVYTGSAFVVAHTLSGQPLRSSFRLRGSTDADVRTNQPPIPAMTISVLRENVIIAGVPAEVTMITVDATTSSDSDGVIASWSIALDGTMYTGAAIADALITHVSTAPSPVPVTLTVTDDGGLPATLTQNATWSDATILVEPLVAAEATQAEASTDGERTWNTQTLAATAVAAIALGNGTLYGCADGTLYRSLDMLATPPTLVTTFPAGVNCLWNNEQLKTRWLAGLDNGDVWLSIDSGVTWTKLSTFGAAVNDISESPAAANQMTAAAGNNLWTTFDGVTWEPLITHNTTCLRFAAAGYGGQARVYAGFADGVIKRWSDDGAGTIDVIATVPAGRPIRGLTLAVKTEEVYVFTDTTSTYIWTAAAGLVAGPDLGSAANRAIRSGSGLWVYTAEDGAIGKWLPRGTRYDVRILTAPQRGLAVGYGARGRPVVRMVTGEVEILIPTWGTTPSGVWHHVPGFGWSFKGGLPDGVYWNHVAVSPLNGDHWLMMGSRQSGANPTYPYQMIGGNKFLKMSATDNFSPIWISTDNGATWAEAPVEVPDDTATLSYMQWAEWSSSTAGRWYTSGQMKDMTGQRHRTVMAGDLLVPRTPWYDESLGLDITRNTAGEDEDLIFTWRGWGADPGIGHIDAATYMLGGPGHVVPPTIPVTPPPVGPWLDMDPASRATYAFETETSSRLWYSSDYRTVPFRLVGVPAQARFSNQYGRCAAVVGGVFTINGHADVLFVSNFVEYFDTAGADYVAVDRIKKNNGWIRSDRQTKTCVMVRAAFGSKDFPEEGFDPDLAVHGDCHIFDGSQWSMLQGPAGSGTLANRGEVIVRGGP